MLHGGVGRRCVILAQHHADCFRENSNIGKPLCHARDGWCSMSDRVCCWHYAQLSCAFRLMSLVCAVSCFRLFAELNGALTPVFADEVSMSPLERRVMHLDGSLLVFCCVVGCSNPLTATEVQCYTSLCTTMHAMHYARLALPR
jgi:hypothetical protein